MHLLLMITFMTQQLLNEVFVQTMVMKLNVLPYFNMISVFYLNYQDIVCGTCTIQY